MQINILVNFSKDKDTHVDKSMQSVDIAILTRKE